MSFSVFGTLARLGIRALVNYPGQSIFPLAWVQTVGCFVMGFTLALREPIITFYPPLYTAITTGFCGSLTTFSGWQLDVFQAWANMFGPRKLWIYNVMDGLTRLLFTLALSLASLNLGVHLGKQLISRFPVLSPPAPSVRWAMTSISIALYALTIPFFVRLNHSWRPLATAAIMFSFTGTLSRYILSTQLNSRSKTFPLGTLLANEMATMILAMCHIIQRDPSPPSPVTCSILQGFIDGYCGCMSTVSTFASEVRAIRGTKAWQYVAVSLSLGQAILLVMLGPAWWTGRINDHNVCSPN
ncbi:CrcB-like protein-domain-containing protein [Hysterangium stoloniferum]|nr:CrcB-like protein-domain-containing protein [Hysterangium stoloniferum]